jgi:hypothetical protein
MSCSIGNIPSELSQFVEKEFADPDSINVRITEICTQEYKTQNAAAVALVKLVEDLTLIIKEEKRLHDDTSVVILQLRERIQKLFSEKKPESEKPSSGRQEEPGPTITADMTEQAIQSTPAIDVKFTSHLTIEEQRKAHEKAKAFLQQSLAAIGVAAEFVSVSTKDAQELSRVTIDRELDPSVFSYQYTAGVTDDIIKDGQRVDDAVVVYGAASQFNGCEAPTKRTIAPGGAYNIYQRDHTQGPQAQVAFSPAQVELINCGGNIGFNGLCYVFNEETKNQVEHGYFIPSKEKAGQIIQQLCASESHIEYPCVAAVPLKGAKPVHLILVAAPAFSMFPNDGGTAVEGKDSLEIQYLCALHAYRAQFQQCIALAQKTKKPVRFKPTAVGLGAFGNEPTVVAKAFYQAALEFERDLRDNKVTVSFQIFRSARGADPKATKMAEELKLKA